MNFHMKVVPAGGGGGGGRGTPLFGVNVRETMVFLPAVASPDDTQLEVLLFSRRGGFCFRKFRRVMYVETPARRQTPTAATAIQVKSSNTTALPDVTVDRVVRVESPLVDVVVVGMGIESMFASVVLVASESPSVVVGMVGGEVAFSCRCGGRPVERKSHIQIMTVTRV